MVALIELSFASLLTLATDCFVPQLLENLLLLKVVCRPSSFKAATFERDRQLRSWDFLDKGFFAPLDECLELLVASSRLVVEQRLEALSRLR